MTTPDARTPTTPHIDSSRRGSRTRHSHPFPGASSALPSSARSKRRTTRTRRARLAPYFAELVGRCQAGWRAVVSQAARSACRRRRSRRPRSLTATAPRASPPTCCRRVPTQPSRSARAARTCRPRSHPGAPPRQRAPDALPSRLPLVSGAARLLRRAHLRAPRRARRVGARQLDGDHRTRRRPRPTMRESCRATARHLAVEEKHLFTLACPSGNTESTRSAERRVPAWRSSLPHDARAAGCATAWRPYEAIIARESPI